MSGIAVQTQPSAPSSQIQKLLDENSSLICTISEYQNLGRHQETLSYQWQLHRNLINLMYLGQIADSSTNVKNLIPPPPGNITLASPGNNAMTGAAPMRPTPPSVRTQLNPTTRHAGVNPTTRHPGVRSQLTPVMKNTAPVRYQVPSPGQQRQQVPGPGVQRQPGTVQTRQPWPQQ